MFNPVSNQFHITYKKREVPILIPIERQLCKEMGLTRSDLHKNAIKRLWNSRQEKQLKLVWENNEASKSKSCEISNAYWTSKGQQKKYWELFGRLDWFDLFKEKVNADWFNPPKSGDFLIFKTRHHCWKIIPTTESSKAIDTTKFFPTTKKSIPTTFPTTKSWLAMSD